MALQISNEQVIFGFTIMIIIFIFLILYRIMRGGKNGSKS